MNIRHMSMFEVCEPFPDDPIIGLIKAYAEDTNAHKIDLGAGVYQNESGQTPVLDTVKLAEKLVDETERTKSYLGLAGNEQFCDRISSLLLGADHSALRSKRVATIQSVGGSGGLRVAAQCISELNPSACIWVGEPTWANHQPLLSGAKCRLRPYTYYDFDNHCIAFERMLTDLAEASHGDFVLLHGCCHNPTGADLSKNQWQALVKVLDSRGLIPLVDVAYQGFGTGLDDDAYGLRLCADQLAEVFFVGSCAKNFGLYRERVGSVSVVAKGRRDAEVAASYLKRASRTLYSMPPNHGAAIVGEILSESTSRQRWENELAGMRERINQVRRELASKLSQRTNSNRFNFIATDRGMFSLLGISTQQVRRLRSEYSIYLVNSSRVNIAGIRSTNIDYLVDSITTIILPGCSKS
jgi:aspartate aminotransferase